MGAPMAPRAPMALIGGGGAKKVLTVQLGNETTDNSKRQGNKEDRQAEDRVRQVPIELAEAGNLPGVMTAVQPGR